MTITYSIDHTGGSEQEPILKALASNYLTGLSPLTPTVTKEGESVQPYTAAVGDPAYPAQVVVRSGLQKRATGTVRHNAVTLQTWATSVDSVSGEVVKRQVPITLSWNTPSDLQVEPDDISWAIQGLALLVISNVGNSVDSARIAKMQFGITDIF